MSGQWMALSAAESAALLCLQNGRSGTSAGEPGVNGMTPFRSSACCSGDRPLVKHGHSQLERPLEQRWSFSSSNEICSFCMLFF